MKTSLLLAALPFVAAITYKPPPDGPVANLDSGPIRGVRTSLRGGIGPVNKFYGVPYAEKPERFGLPKKPTPWKTTRTAFKYGPSCNQFISHTDIGSDYKVVDEIYNNHPAESEDCLFANVFAPSWKGPSDGRPIVLFIQGGGFQLGNGEIDMSGFAAYEDIIAISFNYRTNIFGFPNSPDIPLKERNLGLYDQRLAIQWVQTNAAAFGGNSSKVTLWGESAGSMSIDAHLQAYAKSKPAPFRAGILSSGQFSFGPLSFGPNSSDHSTWEVVAAQVGCPKNDTQLDCMRKVPVKKLLEAQDHAQASFEPLTDGYTLLPGRAKSWRAGKVARVPILTGTVRDEGRSLVNTNISLRTFEDVYLPTGLVTKKQKDAILGYYKKIPGLRTDFAPSHPLPNRRSPPNAHMALPLQPVHHPLLPPQFAYLQKFHASDTILLFSGPSFEGGNIPGLTPELYSFATYWRGQIADFVRNPGAGSLSWPAVGGKYKQDVAVLGDVGNVQVAGGRAVDVKSLDQRCSLYQDIYKALEKFA
ncbi:Lipase 5 [Cladobotryum mycophilum]|uniref:Carboxylic ester hydrolase n=1 Tax=Cladobotryum mycophilum TaxID=491253 RepID=A0ABR0SPT0_9HYPO